jgi:hypothetical protein
MWTKLKALWARLPHQVQAILTTGAATFITTTGNAISTGGCVTPACIKQYATTAITTIGTTLYAFYMRPNRPGGPPPLISVPGLNSQAIGGKA